MGPPARQVLFYPEPDKATLGTAHAASSATNLSSEQLEITPALSLESGKDAALQVPKKTTASSAASPGVDRLAESSMWSFALHRSGLMRLKSLLRWRNGCWYFNGHLIQAEVRGSELLVREGMTLIPAHLFLEKCAEELAASPGTDDNNT